MTEAYIYDAVRTPRGKGKADGALHEVTAINLSRTTLQAIQTRNNLDTKLIDDVILGCVDPVGEASGVIARSAALASGYGATVPGMQINRFCASGLDAVAYGAAQVMAGQKDLIIGGGVEAMSRIGMGASGMMPAVDPSVAIPSFFSPQGVAADLIATKYGFSRQDVDAYAVQSHQRAANAWEKGYYNQSVIPVRDVNGLVILARDETIRPNTDVQTLGSLKASFAMMGEQGGFDAVAIQGHPEVEAINHVHHAGNSSGIVDGASAILVGNKAAGKSMGIKPKARIKAFASLGSDLALVLTGPVDVTQKLLKRARMKMKDIDLIEINEAFSAVVLRYCQAFELNPNIVNVNGGAIAMGHPLGATGAMILGALVDELERRDLNVGLVTLCVAHGMGTAMIVERV